MGKRPSRLSRIEIRSQDWAPPAGRRYLGVAHGWAGFLLATLRWCAAAGVPRPAAVEDRLTQLAGQAYALLELYRHTGERRWLTAAIEPAVRPGRRSRRCRSSAAWG